MVKVRSRVWVQALELRSGGSHDRPTTISRWQTARSLSPRLGSARLVAGGDWRLPRSDGQFASEWPPQVLGAGTRVRAPGWIDRLHGWHRVGNPSTHGDCG